MSADPTWWEYWRAFVLLMVVLFGAGAPKFPRWPGKIFNE